jgi:hypothetical protein
MPKSALNQNFRRPRPAYIDGGLAAILLQGAAGAVLAGLLYLKIYWQKVKSFFVRADSGPASAGSGENGSDPQAD